MACGVWYTADLYGMLTHFETMEITIALKRNLSKSLVCSVPNSTRDQSPTKTLLRYVLLQESPPLH